MLTTEDVLARHETALGAQDSDRIARHYAQDAVAVVNGATYRGPREIAGFYASLIRDLPDARWRTDVAVVHGDLAYVEWSCASAASRVDFGTDTFVVANGLIARQTASFSIVPDAR